MDIGIIKEEGNEKRVAFLPAHVKNLQKLGLDPVVENDAGQNAFTGNDEYIEQGAKSASRKKVLEHSQILASINPLTNDEVQELNSGITYISLFPKNPDPNMVMRLLEKKITVMDLASVPRISRAQTMDVLSSQANIAGYKAVLLAAYHLPKFFPMLTTAAGNVPPAKVLVLGTGVAGLQAIATAKRLGAIVEAFDVRQAVKEEVESLGAKFVAVEGSNDGDKSGYATEQSKDFKEKQQQVIQDHAVKADVVITSAQIPGKKAPLLVSKKAVEQMKAGSIIVDLAASTGGNCEVTKNNKLTEHKKVQIAGYSNLSATLPRDASALFGKNLLAYLKLFVKEGEINLNFDDTIIKDTCLIHNGEIFNNDLNEMFNQEMNVM